MPATKLLAMVQKTTLGCKPAKDSPWCCTVMKMASFNSIPLYISHTNLGLSRRLGLTVIWKLRWLVPYSKTEFEVSCSSSEAFVLRNNLVSKVLLLDNTRNYTMSTDTVLPEVKKCSSPPTPKQPYCLDERLPTMSDFEAIKQRSCWMWWR